MKTKRLIVGVDALAAAFGVSRATLYNRIRDGHPISKIIFRHPMRDLWCAKRAEVEAFMRGTK